MTTSKSATGHRHGSRAPRRSVEAAALAFAFVSCGGPDPAAPGADTEGETGSGAGGAGEDGGSGGAGARRSGGSGGSGAAAGDGGSGGNAGGGAAAGGGGSGGAAAGSGGSGGGPTDGKPPGPGDQNTCGTKCCDVTKFGAKPDDGGDDQPAIQAAITAALKTSHKYVYIPAGTWDVGSTIDMTSGKPARITIAGAHSKNTRLRWMKHLNYHIFNTPGGYDHFKVDLRTMTIDGSHLDFASGSGHAVRVASGWDAGYLHVQNLNVVHPGFYGVGIQNGSPGAKPVRSFWLKDSFVGSTGSDGIDLKAPPDANNYDVQIHNVIFHDIGNSVRGLDASGNGSDAAIDMTAEGFGIYRVTIVTDAYKTFENVWHPVYEKHVTGTNTIQGIRLRKRGDSWSAPAARSGSINRVYVKYPERGVFFEGWNKNVVIERTHIKSVPLEGIYLRGVDNEIKSSVCAVGAGAPLKISSTNGGASAANNTIDGPVDTCIPISEVGALPDNRDAKNWMNVAEPMSCD